MREWGGPEASAEKVIAIPTQISSGGGSHTAPPPQVCTSSPGERGQPIHSDFLALYEKNILFCAKSQHPSSDNQI